ncbi:uncharacterized protein LOC129600847 isoform X2 [Paramacrobiotus metropolitanus]|uniref:uncharacterized protein LOC129600847 isoform X2 n=1 Tax=Paramacrobiotus metropolitanus TaxID=2943436 RepID=UPI002445F02B|nr:uncharacterized protein LOC129600847 isoform X2 [Paramacrobiotus metropolitanus]
MPPATNEAVLSCYCNIPGVFGEASLSIRWQLFIVLTDYCRNKAIVMGASGIRAVIVLPLLFAPVQPLITCAECDYHKHVGGNCDQEKSSCFYCLFIADERQMFLNSSCGVPPGYKVYSVPYCEKEEGLWKCFCEKDLCNKLQMFPWHFKVIGGPETTTYEAVSPDAEEDQAGGEEAADNDGDPDDGSAEDLALGVTGPDARVSGEERCASKRDWRWDLSVLLTTMWWIMDVT